MKKIVLPESTRHRVLIFANLFSFLTVISCMIKLIRMKHITPSMQMFCPFHTIDSCIGTKDKNNVSEKGYGAHHIIQLK